MKTKTKMNKQTAGRQIGLFMLFVLQALIMIMAGACKKDVLSSDPIPPGGTTGGQQTTVSLYGIVLDRNNQPISGVEVYAGGNRATTGPNGIYMFNDILVSSGRAIVNALKPGYFKTFKAFTPVKNQGHVVHLTMVSNTPAYTIDAQNGGTVTLPNGSAVSLPANGVVDDKGQDYTGTIQLAIQYLAPGDPDFATLLPGDLEAIREDGSGSLLFSYGMLNVELTGTAGQALQLKSGKEAELTVAIPSTLQSQAPATLPLWYFDEVPGIWKEEGQAVMQGGVYVGSVKHFTWWNCDQPIPPATIKGRVLDCYGNPVAGAYIKDKAAGASFYMSDPNGYFEAKIGSGIPCEIYAEYMGFTTQVVPVGALNANEVFTLPDLQLTGCPAMLSGQLTDCEGNPAKGMVYLSDGQNPATLVPVGNGNFSIMVMSNTNYTLTGYAASNLAGVPLPVTSGAEGSDTPVGNLAACEFTYETSFTIDGGVFSQEKIVFRTRIYPDPTITGNYYAPYTYLNASDTVSNEYVSFSLKGNGTGVYSSQDADFKMVVHLEQFAANPTDSAFVRDKNITLTISEYGPAGGVIRGTFSGTCEDSQNGVQYAITDGKIAVIRQQ